MQRLMVYGHNLEITPELRAYIDSQIEPALRPFGKQIGVVCVRLHQPSDPGAQVSCYIRVDFNPAGGLALGEFGLGTKQAIGRATRRIVAAVGRELKRAPGVAADDRSHAFLA
jgi:hypothetical protein